MQGDQQRGKLREDTGVWQWPGLIHPQVLGASSERGHRAHSAGFSQLGRAFRRLIRHQEKQWPLESWLVGKQGVMESLAGRGGGVKE